MRRATAEGPHPASPDPATGDAELAAAFVAASPEAFVAVDGDGRVVAWNDAAEKLFGWSAQEVVGGPLPLSPDLTDDRAAGDAARPRWAVMPADDPPANLGLPHRDGSTVAVVLTQQIVVGEEHGTERCGWLFRQAEAPDPRLHRRNVLSQALVEAVRVDEVRHHMEQAVHDLLGAEAAVVLQPCPGRAHLHGHLAIGAHQEEAERLVLDPSSDPEAWRTSEKRVLATGRLFFGSTGDDAALFVPMGSAEGGWVLALAYPGGVPGDTDLPGLARALAGEMWAALRRVELVGELEAKVEVLEATAAVSGSAGLDLDEVLGAVCRHAAAALSCERAAVYLRDTSAAADDGGDATLRLAHLHAVGGDQPDAEGLQAAAEFFRQRRPVVVQEARSCVFLDGPWHPEQGAVSVFGLPLRIGDRDLGVLVVAHTVAAPRGFTNLCQQVGSAVAQQAALAIDNARLFANEREAVRRLEELDRLKADYMAGISHDLRTPLTGLLGFVKTLRRTDAAATAEDRREYLEIMERQANRLAGMVGDLLMSARLEAGMLVPDESADVVVDDLVAEAVAMLDLDGRARVQVRPDPDARVRGDPSQLLRVIQNLLDNALRHSPEPAAVEVDVARVDDRVVFGVRDHGPGIDPQQIAHLFHRYRRGEGGQRGSVGLGLYIAHGIVTSHGGHITVDTGIDRGTVFTVDLPAAG